MELRNTEWSVYNYTLERDRGSGPGGSIIRGERGVFNTVAFKAGESGSARGGGGGETV